MMPTAHPGGEHCRLGGLLCMAEVGSAAVSWIEQERSYEVANTTRARPSITPMRTERSPARTNCLRFPYFWSALDLWLSVVLRVVRLQVTRPIVGSHSSPVPLRRPS